MRLIIAEKPSLARAIADAYPNRRFTRQEGFLASTDVTITWCFGHLLEHAPPDHYDPRYKRWNLRDLPIIPTTWALKPRTQAKKQLAIIKRLLKGVNEVVHAGDPDREGQLLVQETLNYLGWQGKTHRLLVNDMNPSAVRKALGALRDNQEFDALFQAAQTRSQADWLYGINLSRAWTLTGRQAGHDGVLSVGRVQTPVLGLIARRDESIEQFTPAPFYVLSATFSNAHGACQAYWQPQHPDRLRAQKQMDEMGRILDRRLPEALLPRLNGAQGKVLDTETQERRQTAPLPYSLSALQVDAARRYGLRAQQVLDCCQQLYERHKLITYPRSDCRYLPMTYRHEAAAVLTRAVQSEPTLEQWLAGCDFSLNSRAFNDSKIGAHHALAPTGQSPARASLSRAEQQVYQLIARNVLAQFYPPLIFDEAVITFVAPLDEGPSEHFVARGRLVKQPGWKPLFTRKDDPPALPAFMPNESVDVYDAALEDKMTRPPEPFTDASILNAMTHVARYVESDTVRKTLKETDGLGTEATRAGIIEALIQRGLLQRERTTLRATQAGRALIAALPDDATRPERTALWEQQLAGIVDNGACAQRFLSTLITDIRTLLGQADAERMRHALAQAPKLAAPTTKTPRRTRSASRTTSRRAKKTTPRRKATPS